ncbi:MarR family transcriptional regulator [Altericroceibacterium spongiae]|uniref:MarR family transcriptional regulator n=1 Tax=Altericroceibacterium spongiae TaxID=2320269 RepID=A0A420EM08_9SPHN|nr:MarR family transcriptional regulator [Altericroceibacterium spongiae]RKF21752.1 MarR family transcriptional regulator [Altericroceibacterium spongiae]
MSNIETLPTEYVEVYWKMMRTVDRRMAACGASLAKTRALLVLSKRGPLRATVLAEKFNQSPRTVTESIDTLERDGFVVRKPDPSDRRAKLIHITEKGLEAVARTEPMRKAFVQQTFGTFTPEERDSFADLLGKLHRAVDKAAAEETPRP